MSHAGRTRLCLFSPKKECSAPPPPPSHCHRIRRRPVHSTPARRWGKRGGKRLRARPGRVPHDRIVKKRTRPGRVLSHFSQTVFSHQSASQYSPIRAPVSILPSERQSVVSHQSASQSSGPRWRDSGPLCRGAHPMPCGGGGGRGLAVASLLGGAALQRQSPVFPSRKDTAFSCVWRSPRRPITRWFFFCP
eukprot:gene11837-biopygen19910